VLKEANSPAKGDALEAYAYIVGCGVSPEFILAVFHHESTYATNPTSMVVKYQTCNPGNCRSSTIGPRPIVQTERGPFVKYKDFADGFYDCANRLIAPDYVYTQEGRKTIEQIINRFAPAADGNQPEAYIQAVISDMQKWIDGEVTPTMALKIALSAGHHNSDGGSQVEYAITGPLCHFYAMAFRDAGCDVRVITPNDGLGMYPGGLQDVAQKVVDWANAGWVADLYLETHTQGLGDTSVRGAFSIYPDWGNDIDLTVKNGLGLAMVKALTAASGIPIWSSGLMSEKATGVGISGYRLGIFLRTAPVAASTTRLIIEHGAHSSQQDLVLLQKPEIQQAIANASAKAAIDYLQGIHGPRPVDNPIAAYVAAHGGEAVFGKPMGGIYGTNGSVEADYTLAHLFVNKATGKVEAQMKDRTNPQNLSIGPGVYTALKAEGMVAISAEQYFSPNSGQNLGQRSFTYAQDKDGVTYQIQAIEDINGDGTKPGTWSTQVWKFIK
jgi:N-acetylmuramoyl-L-alanine amidase